VADGARRGRDSAGGQQVDHRDLRAGQRSEPSVPLARRGQPAFDARELLAQRPEARLIGVLLDHVAQLGRGPVELTEALVGRGEPDLVLDGVHPAGVLGQHALERRRGLGVMPERELAARDPERQLGPDVEELVEGAVRLRGRRPLEPLEDREGLRGAAVACVKSPPGWSRRRRSRASRVAEKRSCSRRLRAARYW